jgi:anti-sigma factor RsiW
MTGRPVTDDDLNGFVDQELDSVRQAEVASYLDAHPEAARRIAFYRKQRDLLRAALAPVVQEPVPPEFNLAAMIEARKRPPALPRWAMAAAVALFCIGATGGWVLRGRSEPPSSGIAALAREAADSYAVYAPDRVRPVEMRAAERAQFVDWASRRLGHTLQVPDLAASGYRFMGGRVVATPHGPAALFMYDDDHGTRLVMLARLMASEQDAPMAPHTQDGVNGYAWADNGVGYSLVGPPTPEVLHPIADEVRRQLGSDV